MQCLQRRPDVLKLAVSDHVDAWSRRPGVEQIGDLHGKAGSNRREDVDADVDFSALHLPDVLVRVSHELGQLFLTQAAKMA